MTILPLKCVLLKYHIVLKLVIVHVELMNPLKISQEKKKGTVEEGQFGREISGGQNGKQRKRKGKPNVRLHGGERRWEQHLAPPKWWSRAVGNSAFSTSATHSSAVAKTKPTNKFLILLLQNIYANCKTY